jgi:hypothetical protein
MHPIKILSHITDIDKLLSLRSSKQKETGPVKDKPHASKDADKETDTNMLPAGSPGGDGVATGGFRSWYIAWSDEATLKTQAHADTFSKELAMYEDYKRMEAELEAKRGAGTRGAGAGGGADGEGTGRNAGSDDAVAVTLL